jgi:hypothetical protein
MNVWRMVFVATIATTPLVDSAVLARRDIRWLMEASVKVTFKTLIGYLIVNATTYIARKGISILAHTCTIV